MFVCECLVMCSRSENEILLQNRLYNHNMISGEECIGVLFPQPSTKEGEKIIKEKVALKTLLAYCLKEISNLVLLIKI